MQMNSGLILAGQPVNALNALSQGATTAGQVAQIGHQGDILSLYRDQGAGIANGDQNALNALAALDPMASLGVQESRLGMDATRQSMRHADERMSLARAAGARAAQSHAAQMSAIQRQQESEQIAQGLATAIPALRAGDLNTVNQVLRTGGLPEATSIDEAAMMIASFEGALEVFQGGQAVLGVTGGQQADYRFDDGYFFDANNPMAGAQPIPGMPQVAEQSAAESEIARLMETGMTREQAILVMDGVLRVDRDPVTGVSQIVDLRENFGQPGSGPPPSVFNTPSPIDVPAPSEAPTPSGRGALPGDADYRGALGLEGAATAVVNGLADFALGFRPFQEQGEARTALNNLRTRTLTTLATASVAGRPSNYVMQMFEQNVVQPSLTSGPEGALDTATQTLAFLNAMIAENQAQLSGRVSPAMRAEANRNITALQGLRDDYETVVRGLTRGGNGGGGNATSGGVQWRIVE